MSIYATGHQIAFSVYVPCSKEEQEAMELRPGSATPVKKRWVEVYFQHVPNHINEENGYDWEFLPAFVHQDGCKQRRHHYWFQVVDAEIGIARPCEPDAPDAQHSIEHSCDCGSRCVFVLDEDNDQKEGQRYLNPLLVLSGVEYQHANFSDLMGRIEGALEARYGVSSEEQGNG